MHDLWSERLSEPQAYPCLPWLHMPVCLFYRAIDHLVYVYAFPAYLYQMNQFLLRSYVSFEVAKGIVYAVPDKRLPHLFLLFFLPFFH